MANFLQNQIGSPSEYKNAIDELLSFIQESGIEGHDFVQKLILLKRIEQYETAHRLDPEKRIDYLLQNRGIKGPSAKRTAIISDIHGNYKGLLPVLKDIERCNCDRIICLGDLVDGGDQDGDVVRFIRDNNIMCVFGNHDECNNLMLSNDVSDFILSLPEKIIESDVIFTHISPRPKRVKVKDEIEAWNVFDETDYRLAFIGHTHFSSIFGEKCRFACTAANHPFEYGQPFNFHNNDRFIISVGPVGYARDGFNGCSPLHN